MGARSVRYATGAAAVCVLVSSCVLWGVVDGHPSARPGDYTIVVGGLLAAATLGGCSVTIHAIANRAFGELVENRVSVVRGLGRVCVDGAFIGAAALLAGTPTIAAATAFTFAVIAGAAGVASEAFAFCALAPARSTHAGTTSRAPLPVEAWWVLSLVASASIGLLSMASRALALVPPSASILEPGGEARVRLATFIADLYFTMALLRAAHALASSAIMFSTPPRSSVGAEAAAARAPWWIARRTYHYAVYECVEALALAVYAIIATGAAADAGTKRTRA